MAKAKGIIGIIYWCCCCSNFCFTGNIWSNWRSLWTITSIRPLLILSSTCTLSKLKCEMLQGRDKYYRQACSTCTLSMDKMWHRSAICALSFFYWATMTVICFSFNNEVITVYFQVFKKLNVTDHLSFFKKENS